MITINEIVNTLNNNQNIDVAVKENMLYLINVFNKNYPNVDLSNLNRVLSTLKIVKSNKFVNKRIYKYNISTNTLEFNEEEINKGYDMLHVLMSAIITLIGNDGSKIGFNVNNHYEALQAAYIEMLTNLLVGNESDINYLEDEVITTNLICTMIDPDILYNAYFNGKVNELTAALLNEGVE